MEEYSTAKLTQRHTNIHTHINTMGNSEYPDDLIWAVSGNARGEHAHYSISPTELAGVNPEPSCCEVTVLNTAPPCCLSGGSVD